jgi:murein DD-endopeptidase MepM/ murein hydrolase activator NlpD
MIPMRRKAISMRGSIALLLAGLLAALSIPASARPSLEDIHRRQARNQRLQEAKEAEAARVLGVIETLDARRTDAEAKVDSLDNRLDDLDDRIRVVEADLTKAQQELALLTKELQAVLARLVRRTDLYTERVVAAYKAGPTAYLDGLLSSDSISDLVEQTTYHESALEFDARLIDEIETLRAKTEASRDAVDERRANIAAAKLSLEQDRDELEKVRAERAGVLAERKAAVAEKKDVLADIRSSQRRLRNAEAQLARDEAAIQSALGGSTGTPLGGGQLLWPAAGPVTSGFGYRVHPIFGDRRLHTGIDIGAPYGAPVVAADSGEVVFAGVLGGYGNAIAIDHGGGLGTTYNHLSAFAISNGQSVNRGALIGYVGCTGYCTGPHLHFEVRVNGTPVDPMPYLQ